MITRYRNLGLLFGLPGFLLSLFLITVPGSLLGLIGLFLLVIGLCYYSKAKGRHPAWGLFGFLSIVGILILYFLKDKTMREDRLKKEKHSSVFYIIVVIFLFLVAFYVYIVYSMYQSPVR